MSPSGRCLAICLHKVSPTMWCNRLQALCIVVMLLNASCAEEPPPRGAVKAQASSGNSPGSPQLVNELPQLRTPGAALAAVETPADRFLLVQCVRSRKAHVATRVTALRRLEALEPDQSVDLAVELASDQHEHGTVRANAIALLARSDHAGAAKAIAALGPADRRLAEQVRNTVPKESK